MCRKGARYKRREECHQEQFSNRYDGQYREKTVAKVYVFEGEYALREAMSYAESAL